MFQGSYTSAVNLATEKLSVYMVHDLGAAYMVHDFRKHILLEGRCGPGQSEEKEKGSVRDTI